MEEITKSNPLAIPTLTFPSPTQVANQAAVQAEADKQFKQVDTVDVSAYDSLSDENKTKVDSIMKSEDPLGAILEKNVIETRDRLADSKDQDENDVHNRIAKFYLGQPTLARIQAVLKNKGMDSQQSAQALREIKEIIEG